MFFDISHDFEGSLHRMGFWKVVKRVILHHLMKLQYSNFYFCSIALNNMINVMVIWKILMTLNILLKCPNRLTTNTFFQFQIHTFVAKSVYSIGSNITISTLTFSPKAKDNGKMLACQAKIKDLPGSGMDSKKKLLVYCKYDFDSKIS